MNTSENGIALIQRFEGLELAAYYDIANVLTIGYGHTGPDVIEGLRWTESQAADALAKDLLRFETELSNWARRNGVELNQNEFDALVSFTFNVGFGAFEGSTAARRLAGGDRTGAAEALTWWNKARVDGRLVTVNGLVRRRAAERAMFLQPIVEPSNNPDKAEYRPADETRANAVEAPPLHYVRRFFPFNRFWK